MAVITISRQVGSGGTQIGEEVAKALGYHLADRGTIAKVLKAFSFTEFEKEYDSQLGFWDSFTAKGLGRMEQRAMMFDMLNRTTRALAAHGNVVILGRGSFAALQGCADVLNVRIRAPFASRVNRFMEDANIVGEGQAEARLKEQDIVGAGFTKSVYGVSDDAVEFFDLMVDTGKIGPQRAASLLVEAARSLEADGATGPKAKDLSVEPVLASTIAKELRCTTAHS